jgi:cytochrome c oxidase subunit 3
VATNTLEADRQPIVAHHFNNLLQQQDSARFGIWLVLVTEVLFFGGVFCAYTVYRMLYPLEFEAGSTALNPLIAGINSFLLLTSSLTATLAIRAAYSGDQGKLKTWLLATILLGCAFLGFKAYEYSEDFREGLVPGPAMMAADNYGEKGHGRDSVFAHKIEHVLLEKEYYKKVEYDKEQHKDVHVNLEKVNLYRTHLFFFFYYAMTGLHVIHMIVGIGLFAMQYYLARIGYFKPKERYVYVEVLALYWHFVELVWIFLLPLLYMAGHHSVANLSF